MAATEKRPEIIELSRTLRGVPQCEDYERMISGMMYNPTIPKLLEARHLCRGLTADYNNLDTKTVPYDQIADKRLELLRKLVGRVGDGTFVEPPFLPDYGCNITIGRDCFINWNVTILDTSLVVIGDRVQIATGVSIFTAGHDTSVLSRRKNVEFGHPIFIEDDCWIGGNVLILPGVRIGKGCTIGAGSTVTKDIPPYSVAVGSPCRVVKTIPSPEEEEQDPDNPYRHLVHQGY
ncbi:maltose/galactoside acetyltransferase [Penicillium longicatenatum]|uniref:maltose/galactoside acetyltransferase n=1 Tax=Penicillium longicatenatum TaxID=1561947 RepID=UPI0025494058|nr:maltose/galactoside acetyltransferase [Penicillium longicatenatum]KAJ5631835.1 maltose/galactoside acetyltransferase [Penicillium longicatenatum]KAJ5658967.1 maltose/galactoside acetyltransferase [Penicillium longicatenatum]